MKYLLILFIIVSSCATFLQASTNVPVKRLKTTEYIIEDIGTLNYDSSMATDINDKEEIVGICHDGPFIRYPNGIIEIINVPGIIFSYNNDNLKINNNSQVVGNFRNDDGGISGFIWDKQSGVRTIGSLGGKNTWVHDINDLGQVVGSSETGLISPFESNAWGPWVRHAFIWENGKITDLGTLKANTDLEGDMSEAVSINNYGEVIGNSNHAIFFGGKKKKTIAKPFYWNGSMQEIPVGEEAKALNNLGFVVLTGNNCSIIWNSRSKSFFSIIDPGAKAINDKNVIVFQYTSIYQNKKELPIYINGVYYRDLYFIDKDSNIRL